MKTVLSELAAIMRAGCWLIVMAMVGTAPAAWGQSVKDVTVSGPVSTGNAFTVTVTAQGVSSTTKIRFRLENCNGCTIYSPAGTEVDFGGASQNYSVTINSSSAQSQVVLVIDWGHLFSKSTFSNPFNIQFVAAPTKLKVDAPATASVGASFNVAITAMNDSDQLVFGFNNQVTLVSDDPAKMSLGPVTLTNGTASFSVSLPTVRTTTITASFTGLTSATDTIQIIPGPAMSFEVVAPSSVNAGTQFPVTINARDASGNLATGYSEAVVLTSTDPAASSLGSVNVNNGVGMLTTTVLKSVGSRTITGTAGTITGTSGTVLVAAGPAVRLAVVPSLTTVAAGSPFSIQVTAQDFYGNTVTTFGSLVSLSSTDTRATGMGNVTLTNGSGSFQTTHGTAGMQTITANGGVMPGVTGSATVTVTPATATHFVVTAPPAATAGTQFNFSVTARDQFRNLAPTYSGTVRFTSSDSQAVLPAANVTLSGGTAIFPATLKTAGSRTITASDTGNSSITGSSDEITVAAAALSQFELKAPANANSGTSFALEIIAKDAFFNTLISYGGPANISSGDSQALIPASVPFTSGIASFTAILRTAGSQTLTATDQINPAVTATRQIAVQAAAVTRIEISATPGTATAGQPFPFTVTARDQAGNIASGYAGTLTFTSGDLALVRPPNSALPNGTGTFQATLRTVGTWTITATDTSNASITGTSTQITVRAGPFHHFLVGPAPTEVVAGEPFNFTITAKDEFNNTVTGYAGPVVITSTDPAASLPAGVTFTDGIATTQATLKTTGNRIVTVAAATMPPVSEQISIVVKPGAPDRIEIVSGNQQSVPINTTFEPLRARIIDASQNPIPNWQVTFAVPSSGASAALFPNATVRTTLDGLATITATANQVSGSYEVAVTASAKPEALRSTQAVTFRLTNRPGQPADLRATSGSSQSAQVGTAFPLPLVVTVRDSSGNLLSNVDVSLGVPASGASAVLAPAGPYKTDASGNVTVTAVANATVGSYNTTASVSGAGSVAFALTNAAVPPGSLSLTQGSGQTARVSSTFDLPLQVLVKDASGTPLSESVVTFIKNDTGPSAVLSAEAVRTNESGLASVTATANTTAGSYQINVVARTGGSGVFTLTNVPGEAANIEAVGGTPQAAQINSHFSMPLRVRVIDGAGNAIPGATVTFEAPPTGASAILPAPSARTNDEGYATMTVTANTTAGSYFVTAKVQGVSSAASFNLRNLEGPAATIVVSGVSAQSTVVASLFPQPLQVRVRDASDNPIPNALVAFTPALTGASATLSAASAITDSNGLASVRATSNTVAGTYQVEAAVPGLASTATAVFTLTNRAGAVSTITAIRGTTPQSVRVNLTFAEALQVGAADRYGNPVERATIRYAAPDSGQSARLSETANVTNAQGLASVRATANGIAGSYTVTASAEGAPAATFSLTNTAGPAATIEIVSGSAQIARVGTAFLPLVVLVRDGAGNALSGQTLTFSAPGSGAAATVDSNSASTDSSGKATFIATANTVAGNYTAAISGPGIISPATFTLTNAAAAPSRLTAVMPVPLFAFVGDQFPVPLRVLVQDIYGNPVSGIPVNFSSPSSGANARLSSPVGVTGPNGQTSVNAIAGSIPGAYVVTASVAGIPDPLSFNMTNAPVTQGLVISATGGAAQNAPVSSTFITPLTARVLDRRSNPVAHLTVTFNVPDTGASASLSVRTATTDLQGNVSVNAVANGTPGSYQVVATAAGVEGTAVFSLENTAIVPNEAAIIAIVNAASFAAGSAPGSLQTIFGSNLASTTASATGTPLPTTLGGITVTGAGRALPLLYVSPTQFNFQVAVEALPGRLGELVISRGSTTIARAPLTTGLSAPGIFLQITGDSIRAAALNQDYTLNLPSSPAPAGSYVLMFITGIGPVAPPITTGELAPLSPLSMSQLVARATIGPRPVNVQFAGRAPGSVGDQVNLQIPVDLPPGEYPVSIVVNGVQSNSGIISVGAPR